MPDSPPAPPLKLGDAGRDLWVELTSRYVFNVHEVLLLRQVCRQCDAIAALEEAVAADGTMIVGAAGQRRLNSAVTELRQARLALGRLIGMMSLPNEDGRPMSAAAVRARKAANSRWSGHVLRSAN